jgi:hypothetical protein
LVVEEVAELVRASHHLLASLEVSKAAALGKKVRKEWVTA